MDFAVANGAPKLRRAEVVGTSLWDWIADSETQLLYRTLIEKVRTTGRPVSVPFRCDAPEVRRFMRLRVFPTEDGIIDLNSEILREEKRESQSLLDSTQPRSDELLRMCGWCKKIPLEDDRWLEVEEALTELGLFEADLIPTISHTMCPACYASTMAKMDDAVA